MSSRPSAYGGGRPSAYKEGRPSAFGMTRSSTINAVGHPPSSLLMTAVSTMDSGFTEALARVAEEHHRSVARATGRLRSDNEMLMQELKRCQAAYRSESPSSPLLGVPGKRGTTSVRGSEGVEWEATEQPSYRPSRLSLMGLGYSTASYNYVNSNSLPSHINTSSMHVNTSSIRFDSSATAAGGGGGQSQALTSSLSPSSHAPSIPRRSIHSTHTTSSGVRKTLSSSNANSNNNNNNNNNVNSLSSSGGDIVEGASSNNVTTFDIDEVDVVPVDCDDSDDSGSIKDITIAQSCRLASMVGHERSLAKTLEKVKTTTGGKSFPQACRSFWSLLLEWYRHAPVAGPNGPFLQVWRPLTFVAVILAVTLGPFDVAFYWWDGPGFYKILAVTLDVFFLLDMLVSFSVAYVHDGHVVRDRIEIAKHYATTWLLLDIASNTPIDWFAGSDGKSRKFVKLMKIPKILRFIKLLRALKESIHYIGVSLAFGMILLSAHYYTCLWALILLNDCDDRYMCPPVNKAYFEGLAMSFSGLAGSDSTLRLISSPWMGATRTSTSLNAIEDFFAATMTVVGVALTSCFFATTTSSIKARSVVARTRARMLARRRREMKMAGIPRALESKVEETYEHLWLGARSEHDGMLRDPLLSLDLRRSLALHIYGPSLRKVPMLRDLPERTLKCLAQMVEVRHYTSGDMLMFAGEVGTELFIIQKGLVQPVREDGTPLRDIYLGEGSVLGEICFLQPGMRRTACIQCVEFCTALVITIDVFVELKAVDVLEALRAEAESLSQTYLEAPPVKSEDSILHQGSIDSPNSPQVGRGSPRGEERATGSSRGDRSTVSPSQGIVISPPDSPTLGADKLFESPLVLPPPAPLNGNDSRGLSAAGSHTTPRSATHHFERSTSLDALRARYAAERARTWSAVAAAGFPSANALPATSGSSSNNNTATQGRTTTTATTTTASAATAPAAAIAAALSSLSAAIGDASANAAGATTATATRASATTTSANTAKTANAANNNSNNSNNNNTSAHSASPVNSRKAQSKVARSPPLGWREREDDEHSV